MYSLPISYLASTGPAPPVCVPDSGEESQRLVQSRPAKAAQIHLQMQKKQGILKIPKFKTPVPQPIHIRHQRGDVEYGNGGECRSGWGPITMVKILTDTSLSYLNETDLYLMYNVNLKDSQGAP